MAVTFNNYKRSSYLCNIFYSCESFNFALITTERHLIYRYFHIVTPFWVGHHLPQNSKTQLHGTAK